MFAVFRGRNPSNSVYVLCNAGYTYYVCLTWEPLIKGYPWGDDLQLPWLRVFRELYSEVVTVS